MASQTPTILDVVMQDHKEIFAYYDKYVENAGNPEQQERWANQMAWEVARHAVGEELVLYPLIEKYLGDDGQRIAEEDRAAHQKVKELLSQVEGCSLGSKEHATLLKTVAETLRAHVADEEQNDLPRLAEAIGPKVAQDTAISFLRTKKFAPTRAHPDAPNKPPFETVAGLLAAPIDKLRDMFIKFPTDAEKSAALNK